MPGAGARKPSVLSEKYIFGCGLRSSMPVHDASCVGVDIPNVGRTRRPVRAECRCIVKYCSSKERECQNPRAGHPPEAPASNDRPRRTRSGLKQMSPGGVANQASRNRPRPRTEDDSKTPPSWLGMASRQMVHQISTTRQRKLRSRTHAQTSGRAGS